MTYRLPKGLTIGADPELFIRRKSDGKFISADGWLPGSKIEPFLVEGGAVQVDGVAAEFNVDPSNNIDDFLNRVKQVVEQMKSMIPAKDDEYELIATPTAFFSKEYFDSLPDTAKLMGCDPDYDAWDNGKPNDPPNEELAISGDGSVMRTGGGHVHVGWTENKSMSDISHHHDCMTVTKQLDAALYIPSLLWDDDSRRRMLYGKKGSFRPKAYGVEYRPLSNAWLSDPALVEWVFAATAEAWLMLENDDVRLYEVKQLQPILERGAADKANLRRYCDELFAWGIPSLPINYLYHENAL